jgi:glucose-6-phosphate isomerase
MKQTAQQLWERFQKHYTEYPSIELALDISRMNFAEDYFVKMEPQIQKAFAAMDELEKGAIANPDEKRMVGHYWLRNPALAPNAEIRGEIEQALKKIKDFVPKIHRGEIQGERGAFKYLLVIGIGGSALGPQFVSAALGHPKTDRKRIFFFDNTDPDGMERVISSIPELGQTLCLVISKSGGTKETRNGMLEAKAAYEKAGLQFERQAVAITGAGSELDKVAQNGKWLERFPMWDWVGGRTSELSAVGLLPAALQGFNIAEMLKGASACDELTRNKNVKENPAAQLALMWFYAGNGKGEKDMVILPYKDRLELFSRYLQQLIMESIGKEKDLDGNVVNQGIAVYGNKGSTDQHAYIQQLRDGLNNFFATFIEVLEDQQGGSLEVEPEVTSGDFLSGFFLGTRQALYGNNRDSITLTIRKVTPFSVGVLIALFERTVGFYASLINVNAYHQPGVEAGKKAAAEIIELELELLKYLKTDLAPKLISEIATGVDAENKQESIFKICEHLSANPDRGVKKIAGKSPFESRYTFA